MHPFRAGLDLPGLRSSRDGGLKRRLTEWWPSWSAPPERRA
ncbi:hypothetical protein [Streptomyces sp. MK37H]